MVEESAGFSPRGTSPFQTYPTTTAPYHGNVTVAHLDLLDNPIYQALGHAHASFALGDERARRYLNAIGPLAGIREPSPECIAALPAFVEPGDTIVLFLNAPIPTPNALTLAREGFLDQMICPIDSAEVAQALARPLPSATILRKLAPADYPAMVELAHLTEPGPFRHRTPELGDFFGILDGSRLLAMAGERTRLPKLAESGFTEVSGVCTHPDARGLGYAHTLIARVHQQIRARGDLPYLHSWSSNAPAIALYQRLGYNLRRQFHLQAFSRAP
jgi:ribosomal protein S18 acetylase RimI-like enzyme